MRELAPIIALASASALLTFFSSRQAAAGPSARLVYLRNPGAESCPDEQAIRAAVRMRLGYDPFFPYAPTTLFVEIAKARKGFSARLKLVDADNTVRGSRELVHRGDRCEDIIDTMALSISIAIDPDSLDRPPNESPRGETPPSSEPRAETPTPPPAPAPLPTAASTGAREDVEPPREPQLHFEAGLGPSVWIGAAPTTQVAGSLMVRARARSLSIAAEGRLHLPASRPSGAAEISTSQALGVIVPCFHLDRLGLCVAAAVGAFGASSERVRFPRSDSSTQVMVGPRVMFELPASKSIAVGISVDGMVALTPQSVALDGVEVYELPRISGGATLWAVWRIF